MNIMIHFPNYGRVLFVTFLSFSLLCCEKQYQGEKSQNNALEANPIDIIEVLSQSSETVIQLKHDVNDFGQGANSESKFFARIGTTKEGLFSYPSTVVMNGEVNFPVESSFNVFVPNENYRKLYGSPLSISYEPSILKDENSNYPIIEVGHVPAALDVNLSANNKFSEGDKIEWNVDAANSGGVFIVVKYATALNSDDIVSSNPVNCTENIKINDSDGQYVLDKSNFTCIPDGAIVTIQIIRGSGVEVQDESGASKAIVAAYSIVSGITRFNP